MSKEDEPWKGKADELARVNAAVDRELDDHSNRAASMQNRVGVLIGAATVVGAIHFGTEVNIWTALQLAFALAAAGLGVVVMFPRTGSAFNARQLWNETYKGADQAEVLHHTIRVKLDTLEEDDGHLAARGRLVGLGFVFLVASIAVALAGVIVTLDSPAPCPSESPAVVHVEEG